MIQFQKDYILYNNVQLFQLSGIYPIWYYFNIKKNK